MNRTFIFLIALVLVMTLPVSSAQAIEPTEKPSTVSAEVKEKLRALQDEIASKAAKIKSEVSQKLLNRAYSGSIKSTTDDTITLITKTNTKTVSINEFTLYYERTKGSTTEKKIKLSDITEDDYIAALGDIDDKQVLTAKKIVKFTTPPLDLKPTVTGKLIEKENGLITIEAKDGGNFGFLVDDNTDYSSISGSFSFKNLKIGNSIVVVREMNKDNKYRARFVFILPDQSTPIINSNTASPSSEGSSAAKEVTPSVKPTAKPAATPTAKVTPTPTRKPTVSP